MQADDVARVGEVDDRLFLGHESRRRGEFHLFAAAHVQEILVTFERAGADLQEGDAVAVVRIHVGVDLEDEACHFLLGRLHDPGSVGAGRGEGAMRMKHSSNSFTPKLLTAEPKKTGASSARR